MESKNIIKNLQLKSTMFSILSKGGIALGLAMFSGSAILKTDPIYTMIGFSLAVTGMNTLESAEKAKENLEMYKKSQIPFEREIPPIETKPLLTEEELENSELDLSKVEVKPLKKHR